MSTPRFSFIMATYGRREVVTHTLDQLDRLGLGHGDYEVIVVDNASTDGTPDAVASRAGLRLLRLSENIGSCAKARGVDVARGEVLIFLDDDSYPRVGCVERLAAHFDDQPTLGAAGFTVHLPDGSQECSALPHVFVGCGVGLRAAALREVGGLDDTFFMQAEEYDLSLRLLQAGWDVETLADLQVEHLKTPQARRSERTTYYDVRNNLRIIARYLPDEVAEIYRDDWLLRYGWFAAQNGHSEAYERGRRDGETCYSDERRQYARWRLTQPVFERVFQWRRIEREMAGLHADGARRIALVDLGKNIYAFHRAARAVGLEVTAIADNALADPQRRYRGLPLIGVDEALTLDVDAYVVANTSFVHADRRAQALLARTPIPVRNWFSAPAPTVTANVR